MSDYTEFYLNSKSSTVQLDCLELSHSGFSQVYRRVRNAVHGVTVTHEDDSEHFYDYLPMQVELSGARGDLDQVLQVVMGDLGEIIPMEIDRARDADGLAEMPVITFRTYASNNLIAPLLGPLVLEVRRFTMDRNGCAFEAKAPTLNVSRTGESYSIARFPMLSGLR